MSLHIFLNYQHVLNISCFFFFHENLTDSDLFYPWLTPNIQMDWIWWNWKMIIEIGCFFSWKDNLRTKHDLWPIPYRAFYSYVTRETAAEECCDGINKSESSRIERIDSKSRTRTNGGWVPWRGRDQTSRNHLIGDVTDDDDEDVAWKGHHLGCISTSNALSSNDTHEMFDSWVA